MNLYIDTCVLPRAQLEKGRFYRERFGSRLGFELLPMFDLPGFTDNLDRNLDLFSGSPLMFHEPVWGVEHSAPKGSSAYEESLFYLRLTKKYADILHPAGMVIHLSNGPVPAGAEGAMLETSLRNLEEIQDLFSRVPLLVENTGIRADGTLLLDQTAFTDLCRSRDFRVLIDVGHANANGWDLPKLIGDLQNQIAGFHLHNNDGVHDLHDRIRNGTLDFPALVGLIDRLVPDVPRVIEYTRPAFHGPVLAEDIAYLQALSEMQDSPRAPQEGKEGNHDGD